MLSCFGIIGVACQIGLTPVSFHDSSRTIQRKAIDIVLISISLKIDAWMESILQVYPLLMNEDSGVGMSMKHKYILLILRLDISISMLTHGSCNYCTWAVFRTVCSGQHQMHIKTSRYWPLTGESIADCAFEVVYGNDTTRLCVTFHSLEWVLI